MMSQPKIKLISFAVCPYVQRSAFLMQQLGLQYDVEYIDLANKPDWFVKISPMGKVPVLLVDDTVLFESHVILEYLSEIGGHTFHPADPLIKAHHRALMEFSSAMLVSGRMMLIAPNREVFTECKNKLFNQLAYLEQRVTQAPYFCGKTLCLLDFSFAPLLQHLLFIQKYYVTELVDTIPKVKHWAESLIALPAFKASAPSDLEQRFIDNINDHNGFVVQK